MTIHVPLTPNTHHLIGARELAWMRPTAILINTARGPIVDEGALADALKKGVIAGAGLDVYEQEPALHPTLAQLKQVVLLPHLGSATAHARVQMGLVCLENIHAVLNGRPAPNQLHEQDAARDSHDCKKSRPRKVGGRIPAGCSKSPSSMSAASEEPRPTLGVR
jgi:glyoxylate reductase